MEGATDPGDGDQHPTSDEHNARPYQLELFERAKEQNSILVLGTGSGKTFISILLLRDLGDQIRGSLDTDSKRSVFVVNTIPLVHQQAKAIETHTPFKVGKYEGSMGVDYWTDEKWEGELESNEVLVMSAQILLDLVLHGRLPLSSVNLLIIDECHHATGKHPMREIMRQYDSLKQKMPEKCPRVMGLTACVIQRSCKKGRVLPTMKSLEESLDSALVTSVFQDEVKKYTTKPRLKVILYDTENRTSTYHDMVNAQLLGIASDVAELEGVDEKCKKFVKRKLKNIEYIMKEIGEWCVSRAIEFEIDHLEESEEMEEIPMVKELFHLLRERFETIKDFCHTQEMRMNPEDHITLKVKRLLEIFRTCDQEVKCGREVYGLIFVERRNTAKVIFDLLLELADRNHDLAFLKPQYVIGQNARPGYDIHLASRELRKQKETLDKFRIGECNFIVSTSVLEEGVDIRKCNIVIRFDEPKNYRAYVQSRGRARAVPSLYILMAPVKSLQEVQKSINLYIEIEETLTLLCHDRERPSAEETRLHFAEDEIVPPYEPYGPNGPKVTFNSAASLINAYCMKLPHDKFTNPTPEVFYRKVRNEGISPQYKASFRLPMNARLKDEIFGDVMPQRDYAKKSAALNMCKILHQMGELNDFLRPLEGNEDDIYDDLLDIPSEEPDFPDGPEPGTRKRRQVYPREVCQAFRFGSGDEHFLYSVNITHLRNMNEDIIIDSNVYQQKIGLLCRRELIHSPFPLSCEKWGEVSVKIEWERREVSMEHQLLAKIKHFHKIVFETLLTINSSVVEFNPKDSDFGIFIVPLNAANDINHDLLHRMACLASLKDSPKCINSSMNKQELRSVYEDAIVFPMYDLYKNKMYYVTQIVDDVSSQSPFPHNKSVYTNYEDYYKQKYNLIIRNKEQPLIAAKHLPSELNYLKERNISKKKMSRDPPNLVAEFCGILPIQASLWWQIMCLPSILHRLNSLNVAFDFTVETKLLPPPSRNDVDAMGKWTLDPLWTENVIKDKMGRLESNLAVALVTEESSHLHPFQVVHALTLCTADDSFNLERLEVLGDSYLKFVIGEYLFLTDDSDHEGRLSLRRSKLVCNKTLYSLAKLKKIPEILQATNLIPAVNGFLPGFNVKEEMERELKSHCFQNDLWHKIQVPQEMKDLAEVIENEEEKRKRSDNLKNEEKSTRSPCYNPWTEHEIPDKSVADSVEALIGVFLLVCGSEAAKNFLHWLGVGVSKEKSLLKSEVKVKTAVVNKEKWALTNLRTLHKKQCLERLEDILQYRFKDKSFLLQAVTHSSCLSNKVTDCYQRLEYLGDAVLDYLVTGFIYSRHKDYSPGQMTDMRSHFVKNETLARVAAKNGLHKFLLHMHPKLQVIIEKFLNMVAEMPADEELNTESDVEELEDVEVPKALGDMVEAIIGAVYLDSGRSLKKCWKLVQLLMGDIMESTMDDIPLNFIRQLYESVPNGQVVFSKMGQENNTSKYEVQIPGLPPLYGKGKNLRVAKLAAAKIGLQKYREFRAQETPRRDSVSL